MSAIGKLLILLLVITLSKCEDIRPRVFNGRDALKNEYPYIVSYLFYTKNVKHPHTACTGSLISSTCVLLAGHCISNVVIPWTITNMNADYIRYGDVTAPFNPTKSLRKVLKRVKHPQFLYHIKESTLFNDIGLVFIKALVMKTYGKLSAIDYSTLIGLPVVFAGYGKHSHSPNPYKPLQVGEGVISFCPAATDLNWKPTLCVARKCGPKVSYMTSGDSGGPLLIRNKIVGIHIGSVNGFGRNSYRISVMTPVSIYLDWIRLNIVAEEKKRRNEETED